MKKDDKEKADQEDEDEFQLHPKIVQLLDMMSEDGKIFILREDDLKNVFIKLLKMQSIMIEQQNELKKEILNLKVENTPSKEKVQLTATDLLKKIETVPDVQQKAVNQNQNQNQHQHQHQQNIRLSAINKVNTNLDLKLKGQNVSSIIPSGRRRIAAAPATSSIAASPLANRIHGGKLSLRKNDNSHMNVKDNKDNKKKDRRVNLNSPNMYAQVPRAGGGGFNAAYTQSESQHRKDTKSQQEKQVNTVKKGKIHAEDELERLLSDSLEDDNNSSGSKLVKASEIKSSVNVNVNAEVDINPEDVINFFSCVYVLNLSNKGKILKEKLESIGFENVEIVQSKQPNMGLTDSLADIVVKAKQKDMKTILVIKDNVLVYNNIISELGVQLSNMDENARVLYLGAALMKSKDVSFDWTFYLNTYNDLLEQGIDNEEDALNHWKQKGAREGRWGNRAIFHPDLVKDISAVVLHMDVFDLIIKNLANAKKESFRGFEKLVSDYCYAVTPPVFMNEITKYNKNRTNSFNAHLYS